MSTNDSNNSELARIKELAGIKNGYPDLLILKKGSDVDDMGTLLEKLKNICDDHSNWTEITIDGETYIATGVRSDKNLLG
jgi:hypothetical protein